MRGHKQKRLLLGLLVLVIIFGCSAVPLGIVDTVSSWFGGPVEIQPHIPSVPGCTSWNLLYEGEIVTFKRQSDGCYVVKIESKEAQSQNHYETYSQEQQVCRNGQWLYMTDIGAGDHIRYWQC